MSVVRRAQFHIKPAWERRGARGRYRSPLVPTCSASCMPRTAGGSDCPALHSTPGGGRFAHCELLATSAASARQSPQTMYRRTRDDSNKQRITSLLRFINDCGELMNPRHGGGIDSISLGSQQSGHDKLADWCACSILFGHTIPMATPRPWDKKNADDFANDRNMRNETELVS